MWIAITAAVALSVGIIIGAFIALVTLAARGICPDPAAHEALEDREWMEREA